MFPKTLLFYFTKVYISRFSFVLAIITAGLLLANIFDALNRFRAVTFTFSLFIKLITFKLPYLIVEILPLASFIATLAFFEYLSRSNELISAFNAGLSIWKMLAPVILSIIVIGLITSCIIQPIAAILIASHEKLENKILRKNNNAALLIDSGVMVAEKYGAEKRFISVQGVDVERKALSNVTILFVDENNDFIDRIDAKEAIIEDNTIKLFKVQIFGKELIPILHDSFIVSTALNINRFTANLIAPEYISFWDLPKKIQKMDEVGMPTVKHRLYYYKQLFRALMMVSFALFAACFTSKRQTRKQNTRKIFFSVAVGFTIYLFSEIAVAILAYNGIAPMIATLLPILLIMLVSVFMILHLHEIG